jgi:hypothetical protein
MKRFILYLSIFFCSVSITNAQANPNNRQDKIQALYIAYITQQLNLSPDEAAKFWPIHAQYDAEIKALSPNMNELDRQQATLNIKKKYQDSFTRIIGPERTNNFFKTDIEFRAKMIERLRKMRENNMQKGKRNIRFQRFPN